MIRTFSQFFAGPVEKDNKQVDEVSTEPGSSEAASDGADTSLPTDEASDGEPPVCSQAAAGAGACAVEELTRGDEAERRMLQIEEGDGNGERGVDFAVTAAVDNSERSTRSRRYIGVSDALEAFVLSIESASGRRNHCIRMHRLFVRSRGKHTKLLHLLHQITSLTFLGKRGHGKVVR